MMDLIFDLSSVSSLPVEQRSELPRISALYFAVDEVGRVLYIGETGNLKSRWRCHQQFRTLKDLGGIRIAYLPMPKKVGSRRYMERNFLDLFSPPLNQRKPHFFPKRSRKELLEFFLNGNTGE